MKQDSRRPSGPKRQQLSQPDLPQRGLGPLVFGLIVMVVGLVLVAFAVVQAVPISLARISLERTASQRVEGSISYLFAGIPIFWRSLDGLHHLERQDFERGDFSPGHRHKYIGDIAITQVGFMDAEGRTLAWSRKGFVFNSQSQITDFLDGRAPILHLEETRLAPLMSDSSTMKRVLLAFALLAGGSLVAVVGLRVVVRQVFPRTRPDNIS